MAILSWGKCRGRNGWDALLDVPPDMAREALNVHFYEGGIATKRGGSTAQAIGGTSYIGHAALFRFVPGQSDEAAELFIVSDDTPNKILRVSAGTSATALTLANAIELDIEVHTAILNGKLYFSFDSDENRLHVYDPGLSTTTIRRAGLKMPAAAPTVANTGAGSYTATLRYYKVAFFEDRSGVTVRHSELSASVSFTPSGTGTAARITRPALISEGETHWAVYGSADDATYYLLANIVVGTTTYDDSVDPATYDEGEAEAPAGTYVPFPSVKFLISTGHRLIGFGCWETAAGASLPPKNGRVFIGPVLDSTGTHDDERISNTTTFAGWIDVSRNAGSIDRGLGLLGNIVLVFLSRGIYALTPTENAEVPYRRIQLSSQLGAVNHASIVAGENRAGQPCLYFLDPELGPCRYGPAGFQWCGKDVKDLWDTFNFAATTEDAHGVYYKAKGQVIWWIATGSSNTPNRCLVLDVNETTEELDEVRGGWSTYTGTFAAARCSVMFSNTMGASMSRNLKPYVGLSTGTTLLRGDTTAEDDNGTAFQAYVDSPAFGADTVELDKRVLKSWLVAPAAEGVSIEQAFIRASGNQNNRLATVDLTSADGEADVRRRFEETQLNEAPWFQVRLGDASAVASAWTLTRWGGKVEAGKEL